MTDATLTSTGATSLGAVDPGRDTVMGVAMPRLMADLDITATAAQRLTTAFMLTMAVVIPITGFLLQRFNTRPVFIAAMSFFSLGTFIAAIAPGFEVLLVGRIVQACGTAIMMPLLMTTVMTLVEPAKRGRTMGNISIVISVAPAIGPTISGIILSVLDWRWMFILVLPIALGALTLGTARIKNVTTPRVVPLDVLSVILSALGFGGFVYGLSHLGESINGSNLASGLLPLTVGLVGLLVFVLRQHHHPADLHADRAWSKHAQCGPRTTAGRPHDGAACTVRGPYLRPVRSSGAAGAWIDHRQCCVLGNDPAR
jgi:DHA2 family lincomycin resistance protein-like MFS transporter